MIYQYNCQTAYRHDSTEIFNTGSLTALVEK